MQIVISARYLPGFTPAVCPVTEYPHLEVEDIQAALAYGAEMARERYVEIPVEAIG